MIRGTIQYKIILLKDYYTWLRLIWPVILVKRSVIYHCKCQDRGKGGLPPRVEPNYTICLVTGTDHCKVSIGTTSSAGRFHHCCMLSPLVYRLYLGLLADLIFLSFLLRGIRKDLWPAKCFDVCFLFFTYLTAIFHCWEMLNHFD